MADCYEPPSIKKILDPPLQPFTLPLRMAQKPIRYVMILFRSFAPLQKPLRTHRSYVRTEALFDIVFFVSVRTIRYGADIPLVLV